MKRKLLLPILLVVMVLASCSKDDSAGEINAKRVTFNVSTPEPPAKQTKAVNVARYIMAIYRADDPTTVVQQIEQAGGTFTLPLQNNTSYVCLFWADETAANDNSTGTYNATDLKNVTLNAGKTMEEAFFARLDVVDDETTFNVTLKRPTAKVNIVETEIIAAASNIVVTHDHYNSFNAFSSDVMGTPVSKDITITPTVTTGVLGSYLTFAPVVGTVTDLASVYNSSISNAIPNVPLKANFITNIRGSYAGGSQVFTFIIAIDDVWEEEAIMGGISINMGTAERPMWLKIADRNADKNGTYGATIGNSSTDYGYYYQLSASADENKSFSACFDFGAGNGAWRLPTTIELNALTNGDSYNNTGRKLKLEDGVWKIYDERPGFEDNFVYIPMGGYISGAYGTTATTALGDSGYYWTSTLNNGNSTRHDVLSLQKATSQSSVTWQDNTIGLPVRCVRSL